MCPSVNISSCGSTTTSYTTLHTPIWSSSTIYRSPHQWTVVHTALARSPQRNRAYPNCQIFCSYSWSRNSNHWAPYRISPTPPGQWRSPIDPPGPKNMQTCTQTPSRATSSLSTAGEWRHILLQNWVLPKTSEIWLSLKRRVACIIGSLDPEWYHCKWGRVRALPYQWAELAKSCFLERGYLRGMDRLTDNNYYGGDRFFV